jgi:PmbA protein
MSAWKLEDIAAFVLERARAAGATAADVVVAEGDSLATSVRLGEVEKLQRARGRHLGLRAFLDHRSAITSSADLSRESLERLAEETCAMARVIESDEVSGLPDPAELAGALPELDLFHPREITADEGLAMAREAEAAALGADPRITNSEGGEFSSDQRHVAYASSLGFAGHYRLSSFSLAVVPVATQDGEMQRDYWYSSRRSFDDLEAPEQVGRTAARRTLRRLGARKVPTQQIPVIFEAEAAASLLRHLAGAVSGYALYKGTSFLAGKLGERIAPDWVTVVDDGTLPRALGSRPFDGEGVRTRRTAVVERGVLRSYLFDSYSARKLGGRTTGNASRSIGDSPHVGSHNLFLEPGTTATEDIIGAVRQGLYVTELIGHGVNPVTGDYSRGAVGLWIENGELAHPVEEITIAGNLLHMLRDIETIGAELDFRASTVSPTLKISRMTVAGGKSGA